MGETEKEKTSPSVWFDGLKAEFAKIVWPDKKSMGRQTVAVVVVSVILGIIITILDLLVQNGVDFLVNI